MSVIRQPGVLGRTTRRRIVGVTAALTTAVIEALAVGLWFGLVVGTRSPSTALAGLGILFCGAVLRTEVFGITVTDFRKLLQPLRLGAVLASTAGWILWLFVAETIGGVHGLVAAAIVLTGVLVGQLYVERRAFRIRTSDAGHPVFSVLFPAMLLGVGATLLLASAWFTDWALVSPPLFPEVTTLVIRIEAVQIGVVLFGLFAFLAHQRRYQRFLDP